MNTLELGHAGESMAAEYHESNGWDVIKRNYSCHAGEIDIIAKRGSLIAFVEVKTRRTMAFGRPSEAVGKEKQAHIKRAAAFYVREALDRTGAANGHEFRFDVIEVLARESGALINHIENAF